MRRFGAALAISVLLATSGCGGGGSSRPSADDVSKALRKGGPDSLLGAAGSQVNKKAADCIAEALVDSRISDKALQALVDGKKGYRGTKADTTAVAAVSSKMVKCISDNVATK